MKTKITLHFYAKSTKMNVNGNLPIYVRLTINGERTEFSSKKFIDKAKWSTELAKMKGNTEEARSINSYLDMMRSKVLSAEMDLIHKDEDVSLQNVQSIIKGLYKNHRTLIPIFQDHNDKMKELVGKKYAYGTLQRFEVTLNHIQNFLLWKYNASDILINKVDHAMITDLEFYLRSIKNCANNTAVKYIRNFRKIIKICLNNDWLEKNPFSKYEGKVYEIDKEFLTEEEIQKIYAKKFMNARLEQVRDIFIFCCFTGLAYIDVQQLRSDHLGIGIDGNKWIFKNRQKTDTRSKIPLLPIAEDLIHKYSNHPKCIDEDRILPVLSNQKMNSYLKEIGDVCGIQKEITFHMARHSFATSITLTNGVPIESVSKMLGHKNLRTTQHYAKVLDRKVSDDMNLLREKFSLPAAKQEII
ncbi:site-specific integrase [Flavobacterium sinopsychrotolerans]|uniref:Site-specific recombinase XerD n=1 Tax=Flavobacterium sinopsychrotolerans TaxID=604089 RepID=A0A1H8M0X7_9FLAO|nr:site-specific integrase [Flavobacterium sinopsychrotolerans]SEO11027.1 Site-specific recombinase XerD [Flavobacterium sinopsychrotolerans]